MNNLIIGVIMIASIAFLGFLVTVVVLSLATRKPGQSFMDASATTIASGWRSMTSGFSPAKKSGYDLPQTDPFDEMRVRSPESHYYGRKVARPQPSLGAVMSSYQRAAQPVVFPESAVQPKSVTDLNVPGADAYEDFAADALGEDIDAMSGRNLYGERQLPAPPLSADQFRYFGDFEVKRGDPLLSSPMTRTDIGFSNRGTSIF
ncbi:MAG: hypothetical protein WC483_04215 [Candidatus Paceibacterota bacterium]